MGRPLVEFPAVGLLFSRLFTFGFWLLAFSFVVWAKLKNDVKEFLSRVVKQGRTHYFISKIQLRS